MRPETSCGVSLPSSVETVSSLTPAIASGEAVSSTWMWAVSVQMTPWCGRVTERSAVTLAPVPFRTGKPTASGPNSAVTSSSKRWVTRSEP